MKLKHILMVAFVAALAACTNQESLLKDYEKACEKGNSVKAARILEKMEKKYPNEADWTAGQAERIMEASVVLTKKNLEKAGGALDALDEMEDLFK